MRLGIDFDGTIADTTDAKIRYALERFGETVTPIETYSEDGMRRLGEERFREMVEASHATDWDADDAADAGRDRSATRARCGA